LITQKGNELRRKMWNIYAAVLQESLDGLPEKYDVKNLTGALFSLVDPEISIRFGWR